MAGEDDNVTKSTTKDEVARQETKISKAQRGAYRSKVTTAVKKLRIAINERSSKAIIIDLLSVVKGAYKECEAVCNSFSDQASEAENIEDNIEYLSLISDSYITCLQEANAYVDFLEQCSTPAPVPVYFKKQEAPIFKGTHKAWPLKD